MSDVVEAAPSAMLICTGEGKARMLNPSAARLTGLAAGENCSGIWADYQGYLDLCAGAEQGLPAVNVPMAVRRLDAPDGPVAGKPSPASAPSITGAIRLS